LLARKVKALCEVWMLDIRRGTMLEIAHGRDNEEAVWSPDGRRIAYYEADSPQRMLTRTVTGPLKVETLLTGTEVGEPQSWSEGGNLLVYSTRDPQTRSDIWVLPMDTGAKPGRFLATDADELAPSISPDGRWIAYASDESGTAEVYVRRYPDTGEVWQVSAGGGIAPLWARDGRNLYFIAGSSMMEVPVETQPTLDLGVPVELFEGGFSTSRLREYDLAPDGRFVVVRRAGGGAGLPELRMLLNWSQEMNRLAGGAE
jgi:Tol biopolymer transport system component